MIKQLIFLALLALALSIDTCTQKAFADCEADVLKGN